ncbi:MAG: dual specificity protein phosphatase family protein [Candidatus Binatia bacterium]
MRAPAPTARRYDLRGRPPDVVEILPGLFLGEYPRIEDLAWLAREFGVAAVLSLQDDDDLANKGLALAPLVEECRSLGIAFHRSPVADGDAAALEAALGALVGELHALLEAGHRVFLHCNAGYNRAPTVAIAYLCMHRGAPLRDAVARVKERRGCVPFLSVLGRRFE